MTCPHESRPTYEGSGDGLVSSTCPDCGWVAYYCLHPLCGVILPGGKPCGVSVSDAGPGVCVYLPEGPTCTQLLER